MYSVQQEDFETAQKMAQLMEEKVPSSVIPFTNRRYELIKESLLLMDDNISLDSLDLSKYTENDLFELGRNLYHYDQLQKAEKLLEDAIELDPENAAALSYLINVYERSNQNEKLVKVLEEWLIRRPNDDGAKTKLEEVKKKLMQ